MPRQSCASAVPQSSRLRNRATASAIATTNTIPRLRSGAMSSPSSAPLSTMPRTSTTKWVNGSACAMTCASLRHAVEREHEAREQNRRKHHEERELERLELNLGHGRDHQADTECRGDVDDGREVQIEQAAAHRHVEQPRADRENQRDLDEPDRDVRQILPIMSSIVRTGVVINSSRLPRSRSRTIATAVNSTIVKVKITPIRPGTIMTAERRSGLKNVRTANSESSPATRRAGPDPKRHRDERLDDAGHTRVGAVDEQLRGRAARIGEPPLEVARNVDADDDLVRANRRLELLRRRQASRRYPRSGVAARSSISHRDACVPASSTTPARRCRTSRLIA